MGPHKIGFTAPEAQRWQATEPPVVLAKRSELGIAVADEYHQL